MSFLDKARPVAGKASSVAPASAAVPKTPVVASTPTATSAPTTATPKPSFTDKARFVTPAAPAEEGGNFLTSLIKAPLTMLARPVQAIAELAGASSESVDRVTKKLTGGLVAPVPQNFKDVKKDVGRGVETAALGLGPVSGGAAFGLGNSLEAGNDLFSAQTALQTALGAGAGKVLDLVGKPLLDAAGKVIGKVTPDVIKDISGRGTEAIQKFAATHNIFPEEVSKAINTGADKLEKMANKPFDAAGAIIKKPFVKTPESIIKARENELQKIEGNYSALRKANDFSKDANAGSRTRVASTDVLADSVNEDGLIRTKNPGGAIEQYKKQTIKGSEGVVRKNLARLKETMPIDDVEKALIKEVKGSSLEGADLTKAINGAKKEAAGLALKANKEGEVPLVTLHDAKVNHYNNINYQTPPEVGTYRKAVARALRKLVEDNSSYDVKPVNEEIGKYLQDVKYLESLDGRRVKGGKLGKYFAQISGNIIGGAAGAAIGGIPGSAAGTVIGGELAGRIKGSALERTLGGKTGYIAPKSAIIQKAIEDSNLPPDVQSRILPIKPPKLKGKKLPTINY